MNFLALSGLINFFACVSLGFLVLLKNPSNSPINRDYFAFNISIALYSLGYFFWQLASNQQVAEGWFHVLFDGIVLIQVMYLQFVFRLVGMSEEKRPFVTAIAVLSAIFIGLSHVHALFDHFSLIPNLGFWPRPKFLFSVYLVLWQFTCFYGFYWLLKSLNNSAGLKRQQVKLVAIACGIGYLGGATNWPVWYGIRFTPYPNILIAVYIAIIAYAILRLRLMDFNLLIRLGMAYSFALLIVIFFGASIFKLSNWLSASVLSIEPGLLIVLLLSGVTFVFDPIRKEIGRQVDQFVFQSPDYHSIIVEIEKAISDSKGLSEIARNLSTQMKALYQLDHAGIAVWDYHESNFRILPEEEFKNSALERFGEKLDRTDFLVRTLETERRLFEAGIIGEREITALGNRASAGERTTFWKIRRTMRWLSANLCVPLMDKDQIFGFLILGERLKGTPYSSEDRKFLSHVAAVVVEPMKSAEFLGGTT